MLSSCCIPLIKPCKHKFSKTHLVALIWKMVHSFSYNDLEVAVAFMIRANSPEICDPTGK